MHDQFCYSRLPFKKQGPASCFISQTTLDISPRYVQTVSLGCLYELFYSAGLTNLSVEVSLVTMPSKRTVESFITGVSKRSCQRIENETAANEGEVGGWG